MHQEYEMAHTTPTSLSVPLLDEAIVAAAQEPCPIVVEADVPHSFGVTQKCSKESPIIVHLPELRYGEFIHTMKVCSIEQVLYAVLKLL